MRSLGAFLVMQVSIWPATTPPRANPRATNFFRQNPAPGDSFSVQNSGPGSKNKTKSPPQGIICLVRMVRYQWKRNIILWEWFLSKFSIIVCLTIFFYRENKVFASLYTTVEINAIFWRRFENHSHCGKPKVFFSDYADMCYTHLSWVFRRLNMLLFHVSKTFHVLDLTIEVQRDPAFKKVHFWFQTDPLSYIMRLPAK